MQELRPGAEEEKGDEGQRNRVRIQGEEHSSREEEIRRGKLKYSADDHSGVCDWLNPKEVAGMMNVTC